MAEFRSDKDPYTKREESNLELLSQCPDHSGILSTIHSKAIVDYASLLKNHFDQNLPYNWMSRTAFPDPFGSYYGYVDPYFHNPPVSVSAFPGSQKKSCQESFGMARTSDILTPTAFLGGMPYIQYPTQSVQQPDQQPDQHSQEDQFNQIWKVPGVPCEDSVPNIQIKLQPDSQERQQLQQRRLRSKIKNETKNIPKNYGKAMITFILSHLDWIQAQFGIEKRDELVSQLKRRKNSINAIVHLKQLWTTSKYAKQFRILSSLFLRKYSFAYIFNSRVSNYSTHIKYKYKLQEALRAPRNFSRIKQY